MVPKVLAAVLIILVAIVLVVQIVKKPAEEAAPPPTDAVVTPDPARDRVVFGPAGPILTPPPGFEAGGAPPLVSTPWTMEDFYDDTYVMPQPDPARYSTWTLESYTPFPKLTPADYKPPEDYEPDDIDLSITPPPYVPGQPSSVTPFPSPKFTPTPSPKSKKKTGNSE